MLIKEVVARALMLAGRADAAQVVLNGENAEGEIGDAVKTALYCVNAAEDELARFYFPLEITETLRSGTKKFDYLRFTHFPVRIMSVADKNGQEVDYTLNSTGVTAESEEIIITYRYAPEAAEIDGESAFGEKLGVEIPALGGAAEYCLINGEISLASALEERYRLAIDRARTQAKRGDIPPRRWV